MRTLSIWLTAFILIFGGIIAWVAISPVYHDAVEMVEEDIDLTGAAEDAYESVRNAGDITIRMIGPAFFLGYIVWAILKMSQRERYTGVYR